MRFVKIEDDPKHHGIRLIFIQDITQFRLDKNSNAQLYRTTTRIVVPLSDKEARKLIIQMGEM